MAFNLQGRNVFPIVLTSLSAASLTGSYQAINPSGLDEPCVYLRIVNASTSNITISFNGVNDHEFLAGTAATIPRESILLNSGSASVSNIPLAFKKGQIIYLKGVAGTGTIYLSGYFQSSSN